MSFLHAFLLDCGAVGRCGQIHGHLSSTARSLSGQRHRHPSGYRRCVHRCRADRAAHALDVDVHPRLPDVERRGHDALLRARSRPIDWRQQIEDDLRRRVHITGLRRSSWSPRLLQLPPHMFPETVLTSSFIEEVMFSPLCP